MQDFKNRLENALGEAKCGHFKMWKSGKIWLFGGVTLIAVSGATFISSNFNDVQQVVHADTIIQQKTGQTDHVPFTNNDIPVSASIKTKASVSASYGFVKWTKDTKLTPLSQQKVIPKSDIDTTWMSWMGSNHTIYEMRKGDKFLLSNVSKNDDGELVSVIVTVKDLGPSVNPLTSIDKVNNRPTVIFEDGGVTTVTAKNGKTLTSDHPLHIFYSSTPAPILEYQYVKANDNSKIADITAQTTFFDIDAAQAMKTDLLPKNASDLYLPKTTDGNQSLTYNASKQMLYANYTDNVENIGDGSGFTGPTGKKIDNFGAGYAQSTSYWTGNHFTMQFINNASLVDSSLNNVVPSLDKLIGKNKTYQQFWTSNPTTRATFRHELFGQTTSNMFPPQAPAAPQPPADPKLPVSPTAPSPGKYEVPVPKLPAPPTLDSVKNNIDPVKTVTDENGKDVNGQSLSTDKKFNYTITQGIEGKGNEFTNYVAYQKAVTKWKSDCEKLIADYQAAVKDKQGQWDTDNQKVQEYLDAYKEYASNYDSVVNKYNDDYALFAKKYANYKTLWADYDKAYQEYKKSGGTEKEIELVSQAKKADIPGKTSQTDITMPDRPVAFKIVMPDVPSTNADDYIYTKAAIKDSIDLSKVVLPEGTSTMKVVDKDGKAIKASITREDKDGKANLVATLDASYVQSDAFYNNSFSLIIGDVLFNIDDQSKQDSEMKATNVATSEVPTPDDEDPKDTNEVDVDPEYSDPSIVKEQSFDGKNWTKDPLNLPEHDKSWQERITHQLSNHADYKTITLKDKWETVKRFESMKVTNFEGKEVEGTTEFLNAAGKDVSKEFKAGTLQKDGKKEQVTILFHVKNPEQFTRAQGDELKLYMTFTGVTTKGASGQEEVNYLDKDDSIKLPDTASTEWTDKTPDDGDKGKGSQTSNTVIDVLPKLDPNLRKFVVTKQEGKHETSLDSKSKYKPDYLKDTITTDGDTLVAQKEIKNGEQVTWAIVGTSGNQGLMTQVTDTLPKEFSFDPTSKDAFTAYVLKNDGTLGEEITDHFDYKIKGRVATATPKSAADFFFVGSSTDSRYVILVNTIANENISDGTEFVNHANQTTVNPNNPDHPKDNPSDAKVVTPKQKGTLPLTGSQSRGILTVIGLVMMSIAGFAVWRGKSFKKSEDNEGTSDSTAK